jgi:tetratricopeptide (TPR) repeat protein
MKKYIYFILFLLSFILYGNSIFNNYSLDDNYIIENKYVQQGIAGIPDIITHRYGVERLKVVLDYRPITLISYAFEFQFFKQSPHISHFINIILYALCLIVLYSILISILDLQKIHKWLPLVVIVFYAIHPLHTEVVDSLKNRDELFGLLFGLLFIKSGYSFYTTSNQRIKFAILTLIFFILTLLSKMVGILYLPIFILILYYHDLLKWNKWNYTLLLCCFISLVSISLAILSGFKREVYSFENALVGVSDVSIIFSTCFKIIFYHIKMLVVPYPLRFYYGYNLFPIQSTFEPIVMFSFIFHVGLLLIGIKKMKQKDVLGLLILCYLGCMFLYFNFPIPYTGMFSERALFLSSAWFIAVVVILIFRLLNYWQNNVLKYALATIALLFFIGYSFETIQRNFYWKNQLSLMSHDMPYLENSVTANYIYANVLNKESNLTTDKNYATSLAIEAAKHYQKAINLYPYYPDYFFQLARIYKYKLDNLNDAEKIFKSMLAVDSNYTNVNYELGKIYFDKKDFRNSYPYLKKAYQSAPTDSLTLFYYAQNALSVGDLNTCYKVNKEFMELYPNIKYPYLNLGVYYSTILKDDSAVFYFEKGIALGDRNPDLLKNMVIYFDKKQDKQKADYYKNLLQ